MPHVAPTFFDQPPLELAVSLLGCVLRRRVDTPAGPAWLAARIIETEAYCLDDKASHSSLGRTPARSAMFMPAGTIYMYYARGGDSLNFSARGEGNAVLIKAGVPHVDDHSPGSNLALMQQLNPGRQGPRAPEQLCRGQTLLCRALGLKVPDWNQRQLPHPELRLEMASQQPLDYIQCPRLGIPAGRDETLPYRFVTVTEAHQATRNPLGRRDWQQDVNYWIKRRPSLATPACE